MSPKALRPRPLGRKQMVEQTSLIQYFYPLSQSQNKAQSLFVPHRLFKTITLQGCSSLFAVA